MTDTEPIEDQLRALAPLVLGALVRRYGHFDAAEDAVQEALLVAATRWPTDGWPADPKAWLITVASRRLVDSLRSDGARRRREDAVGAAESVDRRLVPAVGDDVIGDRDDTLELLFLCCHPALTAASQMALTLRAVGGLTTGEIARSFLVPEPTMGQRISRAKQSVKAAGASFRLPPPDQRGERLVVVLHVLYLMFNEGYTASSGPALQRADLAAEAIRLTRAVHGLLPEDTEVAGLLALMLLTDARRAARTASDGGLVPLAEQDRSRWDRSLIAEGVALVSGALAAGRVGPYQLQAAIAAVHDEAASDDATDWAEIVALYGVLERIAPNPMVTLNRAVAVAMADGPDAGLALLATLDGDPRLQSTHRVESVRAHLLERIGDRPGARAAFLNAARRTTSLPEQRYLESRAARLTDG